MMNLKYALILILLNGCGSSIREQSLEDLLRKEQAENKSLRGKIVLLEEKLELVISLRDAQEEYAYERGKNEQLKASLREVTSIRRMIVKFIEEETERRNNGL